VLDRGISGLDAMRGEDQKRVEELILQVLNLLALLFTCFTIHLLYQDTRVQILTQTLRCSL
jgi:hypothetical protein